ncbi:S-formylglutathione hydrolase [Noviherbaspirillum denitrificans]|uniref:S-formylglutathione hydrolase n=1 Tax=Noviherbaspirillum denitrificans TaxID=1968433 RepID=A0A254TIY8_9BURK|nr:S-formylglutathione hydrolase [Noviherbaspirillum denitrificans]OWW22544.1 S-formylglutathione hydrolase [Noviherbaspirillum denitrificans]
MNSPGLELLSEHACFGGVQRFYRHPSREIGLPMRFSVYLPPQATSGKTCAALFCLAGLTCTEETFMIKAGAQQYASRAGLVLVAPDTSPRGANIPGESDEWDFGAGAGFYLDAAQEPWARHYRMESYVTRELPDIVAGLVALDHARIGVTGHSMGGHGALVLALRHPGLFRSVSAFAPIAAASRVPWGRKAFSRYLGGNESNWLQYDASALIQAQNTAPYPDGILVDQGLGDKFLQEQLQPELLEAACAASGQPLTLRRHAGYDHGYYFISTFIEDHIRHHAERLSPGSQSR